MSATKERFVFDGYDSLARDVQILQDCMRIMDDTVNADTYFSRYHLAVEKAYDAMEEKGPVYHGMSPKEIYEQLSDPNQRDQLHMAFVDKAFAAGRAKKFAENMHEIREYISPAALQYYEERRDERSNRLFITITGTNYYPASESVEPGMTVKLLKEPENEHDNRAIRAEIEGAGKIGYVANNDKTCLNDCLFADIVFDMLDGEGTATVRHKLQKGFLCELD